jgi:EmrB/QacA subfamily drug resistance transporter
MTSATPTPQPRALSLAAWVGLLAGPFLSMIDASVVNIALPDISSQLHASLDTAQWIISGYLLALAAALATTAYLAKRFGTRRVYLISLLGFTLASALCALAPNIGILIAARAVQGALGAPLIPLAMNILIGGEGVENNKGATVAGIIVFMTPGLGPTIGGLLIHAWGWPLIFLINVPFGLIGAVCMLFVSNLPATYSNLQMRFDLAGMVMLAGGMVLAVYGATEGPDKGWASNGVWPYLVSGGILLAAYVFWALRRAHPAVDLKLLRHAQPALAVGLCALASVVMFAMTVLIPIFLEELQGLSAFDAGLALLPQGLITGLGTFLGSWIAPRRGARFSAATGLAILTLSTAALLLVTLSTPAWVIALFLCGRGLAIGLTIQPLLLGMIGDLAPEEVADGNTLFNVAQRLGGSIGISLLITFFSTRESARFTEALQALGPRFPIGQSVSSGSVSHLPAFVQARLADAAVSGFHDTVWLLIAVSALGFVAALLLSKKRGKETEPASAPTLEEPVLV